MAKCELMIRSAISSLSAVNLCRETTPGYDAASGLVLPRKGESEPRVVIRQLQASHAAVERHRRGLLVRVDHGAERQHLAH